ncbi:MotA/TolQ/ExbB proton channel family protein [Bermanella marisrubri]|uniref:TonB system biopolymer transport component n=1 Tax=Bermanella marisrubri TaxID=207949 RepID=Q1N1H8_9GAMM|nr:MotA/TolQ/ExbB proton channel family protein [Bermanella marisrubri]EAT12072.1 TonB system biopolymer transport component [Oceanobacter sp. RED65] [Bermanella marisrubri]QIZ83539.1 MotA/TolQ/ExbB proton channel family protein [Bermanella marisrubri]
MKLRNLFSIGVVAFALALPVQAEEKSQSGLDMDKLLNLVKEGQARDNREFQTRMKRFNAAKSQQERLLAMAKDERTRLEQESAQKEKQFGENEEQISAAQERLTNRLGALKEMFGVLQQVAGDTKGVFEGSVVSSQVEGREAFLSNLIKVAGSSSELPSIENLEQLWFEMQREMTLTGDIAQYTTDVVLPSGETVSKSVTRVGGFNVVADGNYLVWDLEAKKLVELDVQPGSRYNGPASELENTSSDLNGFWIDPSRGQLLKIMGQTAGLTERIQQGGVVGYIILALAVIGILLALVRMVMLSAEAKRIKKQMNDETPSDNNALGRVMSVYQANQDADTETLELHLGEAISNEVPRLTAGVNWIKIISVVAPLLGLLGTVTGMIDVFETMSLFGTGDPKLMAGGISQALVTTVLGLVAAIPCVFLHTMTNNKSRDLIQILQERATGILARKAEEQYQAKAA